MNREVDNCLAGQEIFYFLTMQNFVRFTIFTKGYHTLYPEPVVVSSITLYLININFNIIHPSVTRSSKIRVKPFHDIYLSELCVSSSLHENKYTKRYKGPYYLILPILLSLPSS